ncbi:SOS response-associated peptidase [Sulfitobacter sabulilitoris]|uniref:Abasic site processing protein n=1 Tax=Sulfitobacter sabulilitoris TaxID=2562655 RepID=A0A5S3PLY6_9RHOB|nr:SOS response-associated peptidase [Sulfitobacter sabulilitoris]TMM55361.1 SOS response-associated peptidase [Sulfitobacter sabulilitoris]
MCGRFAITLPSDAMAQLFAARPANDLPHVPNYNVCPTNDIHVVTAGAGDEPRLLGAMRWGFVPSWYKTPTDGPLLINARGESIAEKPAFRKAARDRRGLVVASGFYEWTKTPEGERLPWYITRRDGDPVVMAAIWQDWTGPEDTRLRTCAIVTTTASQAMSALHTRMPVVVAQPDWPLWLGEAGHGAAPLMRPAPEDALTWHRVGTQVNSNRASGSHLIEPL